MKVQPIASPHHIAPSNTPQTPQVDRRAAAIAKLTGETPANHSPQLNQNAVSPEDMGAIIPQSQDNTTEVVDTAVETQAETPKPVEDPALSRQFAQLARQEKALRAARQQQEQSFKAREAAIQAREAELTAKDSKYKTGYIPLERLKSNTLQALEEAGVSYDEVTQQQISRQSVDPMLQAHINKLEAKLAALEEHNQTNQKTYQEQQAQQYQAAVKQIKLDTQSLVKANPEFEAIRATNSIQDVVDLITKTYDKDGVLLSVEEAAQEVENYLVEEATKLTQLQKIKARMAAASTPKPSVQQTQSQPKQTQMRTLTNNVASSRQLSAKERAILAFKGELK